MKIILNVAIMLLPLLAGCDNAVGSYTLHYKITVTLDTPKGEVTGSSVRKLTSSIRRTGNEDRPYSVGDSLSGEAVVIDMGEKGLLFGAMDTNPEYELYHAIREMPNAGYNRGFKTKEGVGYLMNLPIGTKANVPERYWPIFVRFEDMADARSVQRVVDVKSCWTDTNRPEECPGKTTDWIVDDSKLKDIFGEGVSIKSVTVEITDEPVTQGTVGQFLPWLGEYYNKRLDGNRFGTTNSDYPIANQFSAGAFSTGENQ